MCIPGCRVWQDGCICSADPGAAAVPLAPGGHHLRPDPHAHQGAGSPGGPAGRPYLCTRFTHPVGASSQAAAPPQVHSMVQKLAQFTDVRAALVVGGLSLQVQAATLRSSPEIIVATPVRLSWLLSRSGRGRRGGRERGGSLQAAAVCLPRQRTARLSGRCRPCPWRTALCTLGTCKQAAHHFKKHSAGSCGLFHTACCLPAGEADRPPAQHPVRGAGGPAGPGAG